MDATGRLRQWARNLKRDVLALYFAARDKRVPWYAKIVAAGVAAYALSPIDLIPDFIPVLGYVDDLLLVPLGIYLVIRLIPAPVVTEARRDADAWLAARRGKPRSYWAAAFIVVIWVALAYWAWTVV